MPNRKAEDLMTREVVTFTPETDLYEAMSVLLSRKCGPGGVDSAMEKPESTRAEAEWENEGGSLPSDGIRGGR